METNNPAPTPAPQTPGSSGLAENLANSLCYVGMWVTGIIFLLLEKDRPTVRYHAAQSIVVFGGLQIITMVLMMTFFLAWAVSIVWAIEVILWVFLMYKGYQGGVYKLPLIGDFVQKIAGVQI